MELGHTAPDKIPVNTQYVVCQVKNRTIFRLIGWLNVDSETEGDPSDEVGGQSMGLRCRWRGWPDS